MTLREVCTKGRRGHESEEGRKRGSSGTIHQTCLGHVARVGVRGDTAAPLAKGFYLCFETFDFNKKRLGFAPSWRWTCRIACKKVIMATVADLPLGKSWPMSAYEARRDLKSFVIRPCHFVVINQCMKTLFYLFFLDVQKIKSVESLVTEIGQGR